MKTIYLKSDTSFIEILDKLHHLDEKEVVLVIPPENKEFNKEITFELLKQEEKKINKKIIISSIDKKIIKLAKNFNFEVLSPEEKVRKYVKEVFWQDDTYPKSKKHHFEEKYYFEQKAPRKLNIGRYLIPLGILVLIIGGIYVLGFYLAGAQVEIGVQKSVKFFNYDFDILSSVIKSSADFMTLKGILINQTLPLVNSYPVKNQSTIITRASGYLTLVNYGPSFYLIPNTRFVSEDGKIFRSQEKVVIPEGSPDKPSSVKIYVVADQAGEEYNIGPSKFKIPGLAGSVFEKNITVLSETNFTGGGQKTLKIPNMDDYNEAQKNYDQDAHQYAENYLKKNYSDVYFFPETKLISTIINRIEPQDVKIVTSSIEELKVIGEVKINSLGIRRKEIEELVKDLESRLIDENFFIDQIQVENISLTAYNLNQGTGKLNVQGKITVRTRFNETEFKKEIAGKSLTEVYQILRNKKGLTEARVVLWPFWIKKIPHNLNKIQIIIH